MNSLDNASRSSVERELHGPESSSEDIRETRSTTAVQAVVLADDVFSINGGSLSVVDVAGNRLDNGIVAHQSVLQSNAGNGSTVHVVVDGNLSNLLRGIALVGEDVGNVQLGTRRAQRRSDVLEAVDKVWAGLVEVALKVLG